MAVIRIDHKGFLMTSSITENLYTDDPQLPGNALAPELDMSW